MLGFREILGLALMLIGLALIGVLVTLALNRQIFEALALSFPAAVVFRAGVGLFRLATAARIAVKLNAGDK